MTSMDGFSPIKGHSTLESGILILFGWIGFLRDQNCHGDHLVFTFYDLQSDFHPKNGLFSSIEATMKVHHIVEEDLT